ncbi:serine/threonine-protein kinase [Actinocorallia sp. A-T 12471]|uniref:serine/threonine-protein kinase n=1 Tax=Actinocorallia sp. A-T 12471 TaxID=3089813 RepID=UPI0029CDFD8D|nr:protein kinase [Actinocorallia sp. A-T 12471]MDX6743918.1 protein kinase [Actinocorallia sp. A-T 12471]
MSGEIGRRLADRYLLLEVLGSGGMGTVWRARDETLGREVAVKELRLAPDLEREAREQAAERAVREAQAAARLRHPGVVVVHDAFLVEGAPWIIMQLLDGSSLDGVLAERGVLPPEEVARIGLDVLAAVEAAHAVGILHRDIKPGNVFLTGEGRAVLTDFGIATVEGQATITQSGMLVGSPGHIAPERLRGERPGPASDLWSLAATLYRAVEGRHPFGAGGPMAVLAAVLTAAPLPPSRAGELGPLLLHLLARDPNARPAPAVARAVLERVAAGQPSGDVLLPPLPSAPPPEPTVPAAFARRNRTRSGPLLLAGCVAATAVLAATATVVVAADRRAPAGVPTQTATVAAPTPSAVTPSQEVARFTVPLDMCALVPVAKVRELIPNYTRKEGVASGDADAPACSWDAPGAGISLEVRRPFGGPDPWSATTPARAHDAYLTFLRAADGSDKVIWHYDGIGGESITSGPATKAEKLDGIGDEAYTKDTYGRLGAQMTDVVFRVSNIVFEVTHADVTDRTGKAKIRAKAQTMARWVVAALDGS